MKNENQKLKELEKSLVEANKQFEDVRKNPNKYSTQDKFMIAKTIEMLRKAIEQEERSQNSCIIKTSNGLYKITKIENSYYALRDKSDKSYYASSTDKNKLERIKERVDEKYTQRMGLGKPVSYLELVSIDEHTYKNLGGEYSYF